MSRRCRREVVEVELCAFDRGLFAVCHGVAAVFGGVSSVAGGVAAVVGSGEPFAAQVADLAVQLVEEGHDGCPVTGGEAPLLGVVGLEAGERGRGEVGPLRGVDGGRLDTGAVGGCGEEDDGAARIALDR